MNILFTSEYFYPFEPGGTEKSAFLLAKGLVDEGHKVSVLTPGYGAKERESLKGIDIIRYPFPVKLKQGERLRDRHIITPFFDSKMSFHLQKVARETNPEVIHSQNTFSLSPSVTIGLKNNIPVIHTVRDYALLCPSAMCLVDNPSITPQCGHFLLWKECSLRVMPDGKRIGFFDKTRIKLNHQIQFSLMKAKREKLKKASKIIFVSNAIAAIFRKALNINSGDFEVIYNFREPPSNISERELLNISRKYGLEGKKTILVPGGLTEKKGTITAIESAKKILTEHRDVIFIFAGRKEMAVDEDNKSILFPGHISHAELEGLYRIAYAVICPSIYPEPFGRTAIEAFSHSVPVAASNTGGYKETVDNGKNGILFPPGNADALANAIASLIKDKSAKERMGEEGLKKFKKEFISEVSVSKTLSVYESALKVT